LLGLLDPTAKFPLLRGTLAYKQTWLYYVAIIIDPVLRFNWIFYAIFANDIQHSAFLSFAISFSEVCRRGLWIALRVENEHCSNILHFRASRDVPLPFTLRDTYTPATLEAGEQPPQAEDEPAPSPPSATVDRPASKVRHGTPATPGTPKATLRSEQSQRSARSDRSLASGAEPARSSHSLRYRASDSPIVRNLSAVGAIMHNAHTQDFERRRADASPELEADSTDEEGEEDVHEPVGREQDFGVGEAARSGTVRRRKVSFGREDTG
jgi:xenotropic and polytropic retrovirus receptor 1